MKYLYIYVAAALLAFGVTEGRGNVPADLSSVSCVILSNAKEPANVHGEILHCVQNDKNNPDSTNILATLHSETLQASENTRPSTLKECLEKGLAKNYSLRIIRNEEQMAANNATMENAGLLPSVSLSAGYSGSIYGNNTESRSGDVTKNRGVYDDGINAGVDVSWTLFDGFKTVANYDRLRELKLISSTQTRLAVEDYMAELTAEYYNFVQQRQRLANYVSAVELSRERLRIVYERWMIGSLSRLDLLQARVDFNADKGQVVTMCRIDPACRKLFVAKGEIVGGVGFGDYSCSEGVFFRVADGNDFFQKQLEVGNHVPLVYGDCFDQVCALGRHLGLEVITA